ncbi:fimbrial protein [Burkholderia pyrrocinia]|uniref:Fimbrial protein n=1 Tax=Burkholderia pyrrocinia TaxID=60550 RepID=A0ABZ3BNQ1_BURPY
MITAIVFAVLAGGSRADCKRNPEFVAGTYQYSIPGGNLTIRPDTKVGDTLREFVFDTPSPSRSTIPVGHCTQGMNEQFVGSGSQVSANIYGTSVSGIGYQLIYPNGDLAPANYLDGLADAFLYYPQGRFVLRFVKTGPIQGGSLGAGVYGRGRVTNMSAPFDFLQIRLTGPIRVEIPSCEVASSSRSISVSLGEVDVSRFSGIGSTAGDRSFNIQMTCNEAVSNLSIRFDAESETSGPEGVVRLTQEWGVASGVGIRMWNAANNTPIVLGSTYPLPLSGDYQLPMRAAYIQTGEKIRPGNANAVATFSITYR